MFTGFQVSGPNPAEKLDFTKQEFQPKPFEDYDVDIKIEACGICGSDLHTISGGWGEQHFPLCVGHGTSPLPKTPPNHAPNTL
jgi:alcohol dehydrogenase (NADP+)